MGLSDKDRQIVAQAKSKRFDLNSALGQRFRRQFQSDPEYMALNGNAARADFRMRWLEVQGFRESR